MAALDEDPGDRGGAAVFGREQIDRQVVDGSLPLAAATRWVTLNYRRQVLVIAG